MAVTYTTSAKVAAYLQRTAFDGSSVPTSTQVEDFIYRAESRIDLHTHSAWRSTTVTEETTWLVTNQLGLLPFGYPYIQLAHRPIKALSNGSGDKLEIWNGSNWIDWVDPANGKTEGRADDYWMDEPNGRIYILQGFPVVTYQVGVRATYRYGFSSVPEWVEDLATKMAALDILRADFRSYTASESTMELEQLGEFTRRLEEEIKEKMDPKSWLMRQHQPPPLQI